MCELYLCHKQAATETRRIGENDARIEDFADEAFAYFFHTSEAEATNFIGRLYKAHYWQLFSGIYD